MSTFDKRPVNKSIPGWVIALAIFWGLASLAGLFFIGRKIINTARRQYDVQVHGAGPEERALFMTPDELVQAGIWHPTKKAPREPEIKVVPSGGAGSMMATLHGVEHNRTVIELISPHSGPGWMTEPVLHQSARFAFLKQGLEEKTDPPLGPDHYPTYRYCKGDDCQTRVVIGSLEQSGVYLTFDGNAPIEPEKLAAAFKGTLQRVADYAKGHNVFGEDAGTP